MPASTAPTNTAMPRPAWTTFAEPLALNSCTSGAKPWSEKIFAITSAAARSSSLQAGVIPVF